MKIKYLPTREVRSVAVDDTHDFFDECVNVDNYYEVIDIVEYPSTLWFWFDWMVFLDHEIKDGR